MRQPPGTEHRENRLNRVVQTPYPDGSTTQNQYDAIGKQSVTTDQVGRQTSYPDGPLIGNASGNLFYFGMVYRMAMRRPEFAAQLATPRP